jgi:hypothetical protein
MHVSGFTFIRNAVKFDYPVVEAITSILPICDEFVVMLGNSEDSTRQLLESIGSPKIKIFDSVWDDSLREAGRVLADETNKAIREISSKSDWCFYIQGDEVMHEKFLIPVKEAMEKYVGDKRVEGLLFDYVHFYGSYDYTGDSTQWYRKEVRVIRNDKSIYSYRDAQGFRKEGRPLFVKEVAASIYHYGWVKPPEKQQEKQKYFNKLWHNDAWMQTHVPDVGKFDYSKIDSLAVFRGTHPEVMKKRIAEKNWQFLFDPTRRKLSMKSRFKLGVEKLTGWRPGEYRNYRVLGS